MQKIILERLIKAFLTKKKYENMLKMETKNIVFMRNLDLNRYLLKM